MINYFIKLIILSVFFVSFNNFGQRNTLDNPMSSKYLKNHIRKELPRLVYTPEQVQQVKAKLKHDPVLQNMHAAIQHNIENIYKQPTLTRNQIGRRILHTSREFLYRINMLGFEFLISEDERVLNRINDELLAVCSFSNWNPKHFLDVGEMALGVALALDWTKGKLPKETIVIAKTALLEKAVNRTWSKKGKTWGVTRLKNNWNQVCQGGIIAAAIAIADEHPELASNTISRALESLPNALAAYAPDGAYPEGATYWQYATCYSIMTISMFESAFGTDFGHYEIEGFKESAIFRSLSNSHSDLLYNFFDCEDKRSQNGDIALAWFAMKSGAASLFEKERFLQPINTMDKLNRFTGAAMSWLASFEEKSNLELPTFWKGEGKNPISIYKSKPTDANKYYFACKGGKASLSHGNMDAGSFIFDLNGVRWSLDIPREDYHKIEKTGFNLWSSGQNAERWKLLSKNNFGHSTLTVNNELFIHDAYAPLIDFQNKSKPQVSFDLTPLYGNKVKKITRKFSIDSPTSLVIEDQITKNETTEIITWQMLTTAKVEISKTGAILSESGKKLHLENQSHPNAKISIVSLYPAPLLVDSQVENLKRIEIKVPAKELSKNNKLIIRLSQYN